MAQWKDPIAEARREGWNEAIEAIAAHCDKKEAEYGADQALGNYVDQEAASYYAGQEDAYWSLAAWARHKIKPEAET